jgi:hypothetical protein
MIDVGQYRDQISALEALNIKSYERIFKVFTQSLDDKDFYTYNTLKKIDFPVIDSDYLGFYDVKTRMALTTISYKIYGDIQSWWILYLLNKDKFDGAPFYVNGGVQLSYIDPGVTTLIYSDITNSTIFGGRHY